MVKEIIFDTETTGFDPDSPTNDFNSPGPHYIVELAGIEVDDFKPTGKVFHKYIKPPRKIPEVVIKIHGITDEKVKDCPSFEAIAKEWIDFVGDSNLVAHNASFDMKFINTELRRAGLNEHKNKVIDTLYIARQKFPGRRVSLDALCDIFAISRVARIQHGALLDSQILLEVYVNLIFDRQAKLSLNKEGEIINSEINYNQESFKQRSFPVPSEEIKAHKKFIEENIENPIWNKYEKL